MEEDPLFVLHELKRRLEAFMCPEVLEKAADLLEHLKNDDMLDRYRYFSDHSISRSDCRYTKMAMNIFLKEEGEDVKSLIDWLYKNWAKKT